MSRLDQQKLLEKNNLSKKICDALQKKLSGVSMSQNQLAQMIKTDRHLLNRIFDSRKAVNVPFAVFLLLCASLKVNLAEIIPDDYKALGLNVMQNKTLLKHCPQELNDRIVANFLQVAINKKEKENEAFKKRAKGKVRKFNINWLLTGDAMAMSYNGLVNSLTRLPSGHFPMMQTTTALALMIRLDIKFEIIKNWLAY